MIALAAMIVAAGAPPLAGAVPGGADVPYRYVVVERAEDGRLRALWQARVLLAPGRAAVPAGARRGRDAVIATVRDAQERPLLEQVLQAPHWLRGEFARADGDPDAPLDGHLARLERSALVVRVPDIDGARLELGSPGAPVLAVPAAETSTGGARLPVGGTASTIAIQVTGPPSNRLDLVIVGEGYAAGSSAAFLADAAALAEAFFGVSPYAEYRGAFNVSALFVPSLEEGADHPAYRSDCAAGDPTCCSDPAARSDPRAGTFASTAFDARFCTLGVHRLLTVDTVKVLAAAAAAPDWDLLLVLVNDPVYGGSGGEIPVSSRDARAPAITQHELGHSFSLLADEYETPFPGYPGCSDLSGFAGCEANVTDAVERAAIKWSPRILPDTPLPTPAAPSFAAAVGLFEGARYRATGMHRPRLACLMRALGQPFCEVCRQAFAERLYRGSWGFPAAGIDLIEPGSETPAPGRVAAAVGQRLTFSAALLEPGGVPPQVRWLIDGLEMDTAGAATLDWTPPGPGIFTVEMVASDANGLLLPGVAAELAARRAWQVEVSPARPPRRRLSRRM